MKKTIEEIFSLVRKGVQPIIEFEFLHNELFDGPDPGMRGKLILCEDKYKNGTEYSLKCDLDGFEEYNTKFDKRSWGGDLTWEESIYYPKDGIYEWTEIMNDENPKFSFSIVSSVKHFEEYLKSRSNLSYTQWLESKLEEVTQHVITHID